MIIKPEVSVIMSTYCRNYGDETCPNFLRRAIESILSQKLPDFELILIDDGSVDGSAAVCQEYALKDGRVKYHRFEINSGLPAKRYNDGIELSTGRYLTFLCDHDKWLPTALLDLHSVLTWRYPYCDMIYGLVNQQPASKGYFYALNFLDMWPSRKIKKSNFLANNAVMIKRDVIDFVGGYDEDSMMRRVYNWDLWIRISQNYLIARLPIVVGKSNDFLPDSVDVKKAVDSSLIKQRQKLRDRRFRLKTKNMTRSKVMMGFAVGNCKSLWIRLRLFLGRIKRVSMKTYNFCRSI